MYALVDTATEVTAVNGFNCTKCSGELYEPEFTPGGQVFVDQT